MWWRIQAFKKKKRFSFPDNRFHTSKCTESDQNKQSVQHKQLPLTPKFCNLGALLPDNLVLLLDNKQHVQLRYASRELTHFETDFIILFLERISTTFGCSVSPVLSRPLYVVFLIFLV